ncbi:MAG: TlpA family protein disulfide reductase [Tatlockia sp.]|nr:TlpA family protein disulfide reductase [Tatlockia sp.]
MRRFNLVLSLLFCLTLSSLSYSSQIVLKDVKGQNIPFESLKGKWVVINYWASWCQPCLDEIIELNHFYEKNKAKVALFAVNYDRAPLHSQIALIRKYKISYPSLQFDPAPLLGLGHINGVPATFIFNPKGKLHTTLYGPQTAESLKRATVRT